MSRPPATTAPVVNEKKLGDAPVALLLGVGFFVLLLLLRPFAGVPMNDDFSYARTAEALADTGRVEAMMREHLKTMTDAGKAELQERVQADCKARGISSAAIQGSLTGLGTAAMVGAATGPLLAGVMFSTILSSLIAVPVRHVVLAGVAGGGPVGLLVGLAVAVAGTSYSKTIPAVIRLITIKLSHDQKVAMGAGSR